MKSFKYFSLCVCLVSFISGDAIAQCGGSYTDANNNAIGCGNPTFPCCQVSNACNGTDYPGCNNYDPDYSATGGCDLSCAPIDSGVLFLLIGGGLFGGFMIKRRRETELLPLAAR